MPIVKHFRETLELPNGDEIIISANPNGCMSLKSHEPCRGYGMAETPSNTTVIDMKTDELEVLIKSLEEARKFMVGEK